MHCLEAAVQSAELALELTSAQRQRTIWRLDGGSGSEKELHWLVERGYQIVAELSEDPVRLYLREIGEVKLLDSDSEFRLATLIEAKRQMAAFRQRPLRKGATPLVGAYHGLVSELQTSWNRFGEDARRLHRDLPDLCMMLAEAQSLRNGWEPAAPSYLRGFLANWWKPMVERSPGVPYRLGSSGAVRRSKR